jgi:hypothetical protein
MEKVRSLAQELGLGVVIDEILVLTAGDVEEHRCLGSPTILIGGQDIEPAARGKRRMGPPDGSIPAASRDVPGFPATGCCGMLSERLAGWKFLLLQHAIQSSHNSADHLRGSWA